MEESEQLKNRNQSIVREFIDRFMTQEWRTSSNLNNYSTNEEKHGRLILSTITGSRLYGTFDVESSDVDIVSIYVCPLRYLIGLDEVKRNHCVSTLTNNKSTPKQETVSRIKCVNNRNGSDGECIDTQQEIKLDYLSYELSRFCSMMITGNPIALEILAIMRNELDEEEDLRKMNSDLVQLSMHDEWNRLLNYLLVVGDDTSKAQHRNVLVTKELIDNYMNYAKSQFNQAKRLEESSGFYGERCAKSMYHGVRVMLEAIELLNGQQLPKLVHSSQYRQIMKNIKDEVADQSEAEECYLSLEKQAQMMKKDSSNVYHTLPSVVTDETKQFIHDWMVSLRIKSDEIICAL